jgi:hypothetical protein
MGFTISHVPKGEGHGAPRVDGSVLGWLANDLSHPSPPTPLCKILSFMELHGELRSKHHITKELLTGITE